MYNLYAIFAKYPLKFISKGTHFVRDTRKKENKVCFNLATSL